jgi:pyruvate dehydrogenase (quinone)
MLASLSGGLSTMCPGVPYAAAAKFCHPERPAIAMVGDGAMQMQGNAALMTVAKYWRRWADPRLIVLVLHNNDLNQVTWEQRVLTGDPRFEASQQIPEFDYAGYAESLGLKGLRVGTPAQIAVAWDAALSADRPVVIDALCDPNVPPLAPHLSFDQIRGFMQALLKGDRSAGRVIAQSAKQMTAGWLARG